MTTKQNLLSNAEKKDESIVKSYEDFKKLSKAYLDFVDKCSKQSTNSSDIDSLKDLSLESTEQFVYRIIHWKDFVDSLPSKFKSIFSSNGKYTQKDILSMVGDIPTNYEYPTQTLEQDMKKVNKLIIKRTQIKELETGKTYGNEIREEQTTKIIENIIKNSDDKTQHKRYFDEMIEKDKLQFEYLESCIQQETDLTTKQKIQQNYKFLLQYREKAYNVIRENLDKYEKQLSEFLLKLQKMKTENAGPLKEVKSIIEQFVNYKNNPNRMNIIYQNMVKDINMSKIIALVNQSPYNEYITVTENNTLNINLGKIDERNFNILLQKIKQEVLEYINQNDGILIQFTKALDEAGLMKVDFTDMILNVYLNLIIIVCIKPILVRVDDRFVYQKDLSRLNMLGNINGITREQVNGQAAIENLTDDNKKFIKDLFDSYMPNNPNNADTVPQLKTAIENKINANIGTQLKNDYTLKQPTVLINLKTITNGLTDDNTENGKINQLLYNLVNNFIQSTYGSLLLIIQKFTSEYNNIYNLLGKGRDDEVIDDAFGAYVLFNRLHDLFIYQAGRIVSEREHYGEEVPRDAQRPFDIPNEYQLTRDDVLKVYQTIQVKNSSKYFEIYNFLMNIKLNSVPMDYKDYIKHINKLWNLEQGQVNKSVLNPKVINLLRNYIQELINCMIIDLNANNSTNMTANPIQYFGADFQNVFNGINTFDQIDKRENRLAETDKIIEETRPMSQKESLLNLYMHLSTYIDKFTKNYIESYGAQNKEQDEKQFKSAIEKQLEYVRDIYITKTETQSNITGQTIGKDKYKLEFLISTLANNQEILNIKSDFEYYYLDFGIQYRQLKEIHWEIIKILYKYHKNYVEFDITKNMAAQGANKNYQGFKADFEQAIIYLNQNRQNELYTWYLKYYGVAIPEQKITQDKLSYVASYFVNNTQIIETKIYLRLISDLEQYLENGQINDLGNEFNIPDEQHNPAINQANAKLILNYLIHKEIVTKYNPENVENYKAIPFQIQPAQLYIITNNYYNYFQQNFPYMRKFIAKTLTNYQNALKLFIHIPYLKVSGGEIITDDLFRFLDEARKSIIELYNKQVSPYTREEVKQNIRNQLNLSLDIVPVLRDIFAKYVVPPEDYYKQFQYFLANRENSFFTESYDRKSKLYILKDILPAPLGKVSVKAFTSETVDGEEEQKVNQTYNSIVSCEMENKNLLKEDDVNNPFGYYDPRINILNDVNKEIHNIHSIITQYSQGIPELFKSIVMQNNQIKQSTQIFDITYKNNIYQLPINAIQTPFYVKLDQLDVDAKQKFDLINNLVTKHEFGLNGKQFLTPALMQFMVLTQKPRKNVYGVDIPITFNDIPVQTKMAYMNLYNMIKNKQQLTKNNFTDIPNFDEKLTIMTNENQNANIENGNLNTLTQNGINNIIPNGIFDSLIQLLISQKYSYINNTFVQLYNDGLISAYTNQKDNFYIVENNDFENMKLMKDYSGKQYKYIKCNDVNTYNDSIHKINNQENQSYPINMNIYYGRMLNLLNNNVPNGNWDDYFRDFNVNLKYYNNADNNQTRTFTINCVINHNPLNFNNHPEIIARIIHIIDQKIKHNQFPDTNVVDIQNIANDTLQNVFRNIFEQYNLQIQPAIVDVQGQNNDKTLTITITNAIVNNIFNQFNSPRLTAFREINPDAYLNISQNNFNEIKTKFKLNNGIIVQIPLTNMDKKAADNNIITKAYQEVLKDQISQIIKQNNNLDDQVLVLYDKETQRINLFDENQQIKSQDTSVVSMFNALALIDKIEQKPLSMEEKCIIVNKLEEKLPTLSLMVDQYRQIFPEVIDVLIIYRNACQNLIQEYSKGINIRTLFNTNYYTQFFAPEMFDPNSDELLNLFGNDQDSRFRQRNYFVFSSDLKKALIWFILKHKPEEFLKTIANRSIPMQSIKNYYMYRKLSEVSVNNDYQLIQPNNIPADQVPNILEQNKQFMRLAFVKRLTKKYRIIGEDHHYVVNSDIGILAQQTTFATNPAIGGASQPQFSPDWYDRYNTKKEIYENVLLNNINTNNSLKLSENNLLLVDIRRVPYLQKYMKQMYMFVVNNKHEYDIEQLFNGVNNNGLISLINRRAHGVAGQFVYDGIQNQAQLDQAINNLKQQVINILHDPKLSYVNERIDNNNDLWNKIENLINTTFKINNNNVPILNNDLEKQLAKENLLGNNVQNKFQYVIPDHLMYEISYLAGFTNKGTLSFENQLTFDLTYQNNTQNEIARYRRYNANKELTPSVKLIMSLVYSFLAMNDETKTQNFYQLISEPILYTYNCANNRFKYISQIKEELTSNEQNEKLFIILNLQPFHPIQLLKDNQMYPLFKIFNVYLDKYKSTWLNQSANYYMNTEGMFVKLNTKTNYGQEILIPYRYNNTQTTDPMDNQRLQIVNIVPNGYQYRENNNDITGDKVTYYLNYNSKDYIIVVNYKQNSQKITKQSELISLLQNNNLPNLGIANSDVKTLDEVTISRSEIVENNDIFDAVDGVIAIDNMSTVILHIPVNSDSRNDLYVLAKYQNINLLGNRNYDEIKNLLLNQRLIDDQINDENADQNRAWGQPGAFKFNRLISQIFEWILSQRNVINENQNEKNKIRYSQYHILYE